MLFRHPSAAVDFRLFVGNAVAPAIFNDLANIYATLGSYFWLGFITTGLSPDKKRLALLGAQRLKHGIRKWERDFEWRLRILIMKVNRLRAFYGLPSLACSASLLPGIPGVQDKKVKNS